MRRSPPPIRRDGRPAPNLRRHADGPRRQESVGLQRFSSATAPWQPIAVTPSSARLLDPRRRSFAYQVFLNAHAAIISIGPKIVDHAPDLRKPLSRLGESNPRPTHYESERTGCQSVRRGTSRQVTHAHERRRMSAYCYRYCYRPEHRTGGFRWKFGASSLSYSSLPSSYGSSCRCCADRGKRRGMRQPAKRARLLERRLRILIRTPMAPGGLAV